MRIWFKGFFVYFFAFQFLAFQSLGMDVDDADPLDSKYNTTQLGPLTIYKGDPDIKEYRDCFKKNKQGIKRPREADVINPTEGEPVFKVRVFSTTKRRASHKVVAASVFNEDVGNTNEYASVYIVETRMRDTKDYFFIPFGAVNFLDRKKMVPQFGRQLSRGIKSSGCVKFKTRDIHAIIPTNTTKSFDKPIDEDNFILDVTGKNLKSLTRVSDRNKRLIDSHPQIRISYYPDHAVLFGSMPIKDFPSLCKEMSKVLRSPPTPSRDLWDLGISEETAPSIIQELDRVFIHQLRNKLGNRQLRNSLEYDFFFLTPKEVQNGSNRSNYYVFVKKSSIKKYDDLKRQEYFFAAKEKAYNKLLKRCNSDISDEDLVVQLKNFKIGGIGGGIRTKSWKLYDLLTVRVKGKLRGRREKEYVLDGGKWYVLPSLHNAPIIPYLTQLGRKAIDLGYRVPYDKEEDFNFNSGNLAGVFSMDQRMIPYVGYNFTGDGNLVFEPFDIIDVNHKYLISVKPGTRGGSTSHLTFQAYNAAKAFLDVEYRQKALHLCMVCEYIKKKNKIKTPQSFFRKDGSYSTAIELLKGMYRENPLLNADDIEDNLKKMERCPRILNFPVLRKFFEEFDPRDCTVVLGFLGEKRTLNNLQSDKELLDNLGLSDNVKHEIYNSLTLIQQMGYQVGLSFIN